MAAAGADLRLQPLAAPPVLPEARGSTHEPSGGLCYIFIIQEPVILELMQR